MAFPAYNKFWKLFDYKQMRKKINEYDIHYFYNDGKMSKGLPKYGMLGRICEAFQSQILHETIVIFVSKPQND